MRDANQPSEDRHRVFADALGSGLRALRGVMLLAVAAYLVKSCFFVVSQHEAAVVLRFGRPAGAGDARLLAPGLHLALPYPVDEVVRVPARRILTVVSDTFWPDPGEPADGDASRPGPSYTLTGDANILHSRWDVRVTIADPEAFAFACRDVERILACELDRAVVQASAGFRVDDILRSDEAFRDAVAARLRPRARDLGLGVALERVDLLALSPPARVKPAFDAVLRAEQDMSAAVNRARADAGARVFAAEGLAARARSRAEADVTRFLSRLEADASYFETLLPEFARAPDTLSAVLLQDAWSRAVRRADARYLWRSRPGPGREQELRLLLSPEPAALGGRGSEGAGK